MNTEIVKQQEAAARSNRGKPVADLREGDFLYLLEYTLKNDGGLLNSLACLSENPGCCRTALCQVEQVTHCTDAELVSGEFSFGHGGCRSDVFEDEGEYQEFCRENPLACVGEYFYSLVTLVIASDTGRWIAVDAQGYDYARYILFGENWGTMFAAEVAEGCRKRQEYREKLEREEAQRRQAEKERQEREIAENWDFLDGKKSIKWNWQQVCKRKFDFPVEVRKRTYEYRGTIYKLICGTDEQREQVKKLTRSMWDNFVYRASDDTEESCGEIRNRLVDMVGDGFLYVEVEKRY